MNNGIWRKAAGNRTEIVEKWETTDKKYDKNYFLENGGGLWIFYRMKFFTLSLKQERFSFGKNNHPQIENWY